MTIKKLIVLLQEHSAGKDWLPIQVYSNETNKITDISYIEITRKIIEDETEEMVINLVI
jgi:hypothetical protein